MNLNGKLIFLAGSTGLAGASILQFLLEQYPEARIRASYHLTKPFLHDKHIEYVHSDLRSLDDCRKAARECDCAIMAAAVTGGAKASLTEPWQQVSDNVIMDTQILYACYLEHVRRVVFVSTASVYQEFEGFIREDQLDLNQEPSVAYLGVGWAKRYIEKLCQFWYKKTGMEIIIARPANIYGPFAKFNPDVSHFVPALIRKAVDCMDPFEVWGSPQVARDIIYGDDFGRAIIQMLVQDQLKFETFNIGSGIATTVDEVVQYALRSANHTPRKIEYHKDKPTTVRFRGLDCSRARKVLGWEPKCSIKDGIRKTTDWWLKNKDWWTK
jgi:GDP-L-fucose synthase